MTGLDVDVVARAGAFEVSAAFTAPAGAIVVVLGPNGAGKTTLVRALAGLAPLVRGRVVVDGATWDASVPAERRRAALVQQGGALFPALSVVDNVAFGPRARGFVDAIARADAMLARFGAAHLRDRRPAALSGGEAQLVELARALCAEPVLLLLDEPFADLDVDARARVRATTRAALRGTTTVLVTHDPWDAFTLADVVVVLEAGRVTHVAAPRQLRPRTAYAASIVGANLLPDGSVVPWRALRFVDEGPSVVVRRVELSGGAARVTLDDGRVVEVDVDEVLRRGIVEGATVRVA